MFLNISSHGKNRQIINATENSASSHLASMDDNAITSFHLAASVGDIDKLRHCAYVDAPDAMGCTPLHYAVSGHQLEAVKFLITRGADCNKTAMNGASPISMAKMLGDNDILQAMDQNYTFDLCDDVLREVMAAISYDQSPSKECRALNKLAVVLMSRDMAKNPVSVYATECLSKLKKWGKI